MTAALLFLTLYMAPLLYIIVASEWIFRRYGNRLSTPFDPRLCILFCGLSVTPFLNILIAAFMFLAIQHMNDRKPR